jgi:hypothetical protein
MIRDSLIKKLQPIQVSPVLATAVSFAVKTKAASFINLVIPQGERQVVVTVYEDAYDPDIAALIEQVILNIVDVAALENPVRIRLEGHSKFDEIIFLSPLVHRFWKADRPALWESTYVCFPIVHYELPLNCSGAEVDFLRNRGPLNSSDWNRKIVPVVYISFSNVCTGEGTVSESLKLGSFDDLLNALKSISEHPHVDNWIDVESWRRERYKIYYEESLNAFNVTDSLGKKLILPSEKFNYYVNDRFF